MNFFNLVIMRHHCTSQHELSCSWILWCRLKAKLRERGRHCSRESGAFLLGYRDGSYLRIVDFVLYDDLDPRALDTGIVRFDGRYFAELWAICKSRGLSVIADIHVHPGRSIQSNSDREHPMISRIGHIALILPDFATGPQRRCDIGIYRYLGGKRWETVQPMARQKFFHFTLF